MRTFLPLPALFEKYQLAIAHRVVMDTLERPFNMLVASLGKHIQRLAKHQAMESLNTHPLSVLATMTAANVLRIITLEERISTSDDTVHEPKAPRWLFKLTAMTPALKREEVKTGNTILNAVSVIDKLDLSKVQSTHTDRWRQLFPELTTMRDG